MLGQEKLIIVTFLQRMSNGKATGVVLSAISLSHELFLWLYLGEDEQSCSTRTCPPDNFNCGGGQCIPMGWKCDGEVDCKTGSFLEKKSSWLFFHSILCNETTSRRNILIAQFFCFKSKLSFLVWKFFLRSDWKVKSGKRWKKKQFA